MPDLDRDDDDDLDGSEGGGAMFSCGEGNFGDDDGSSAMDRGRSNSCVPSSANTDSTTVGGVNVESEAGVDDDISNAGQDTDLGSWADCVVSAIFISPGAKPDDASKKGTKTKEKKLKAENGDEVEAFLPSFSEFRRGIVQEMNSDETRNIEFPGIGTKENVEAAAIVEVRPMHRLVRALEAGGEAEFIHQTAREPTLQFIAGIMRAALGPAADRCVPRVVRARL